jgi:hypothetical protein
MTPRDRQADNARHVIVRASEADIGVLSQVRGPKFSGQGIQ